MIETILLIVIGFSIAAVGFAVVINILGWFAERLSALGGTLEPVTRAIRRLDDWFIFRGNVYVVAISVWAVIGLVWWLVKLALIRQK